METSVSSPSLYTLSVPQAGGGRERNTNSTSSEEYIVMSAKKRASSPFSSQGRADTLYCLYGNDTPCTVSLFFLKLVTLAVATYFAISSHTN